MAMNKRLSWYRLPGILLATTILSSCVSVNERQLPGYQVPEFELLPPAALKEDVGVLQKVNVRFDDREYQYESIIEISDGRLKMLLLRPWGRRIAELNYDGDEFKVVRELGVSDKLPFRQMLGTMQMIFWPMRVIVQQLDETMWRVVEKENIREIYYNELLIGVVEYGAGASWSRNVIYSNLPYDYSITISSILLD